MRTRPTMLAAAHGVLFAASIASLGFCVYSVLDHKSHLLVRLTPAMLGVALPLLLLFRPAVRVMAASVLAGVGIGLYAAQLCALILTDPDRPALQATEQEAKAAGIPFDGRPRLDVIEEMRRKGVKAYPPFIPYNLAYSPLQVDGSPGIPVGGMSNAVTVYCNETGEYMVYQNDEHGFPNPQGSWSSTPIDVALVGASAAAGWCVPPDDTPGALLRTRYPRTVSLGVGANGPMLELASIREYLPVLKPKRVLWIFSESYTPKYFEQESHAALLFHYLDPSFSQRLLDKQDAVNQAIRNYLENGIRAEEIEESWQMNLRRFAVLKGFRTVLYYYVTARTSHPPPLEFNSELYERILERGQGLIRSWGGTVSLVYWPDSSRYAGICNYSPELRRKYDRTHEVVLRAAKQVGMPVIDLSLAFPDLPASESAKNAQYFYPYPAHFKPAGYHHAVQAILAALQSTP